MKQRLEKLGVFQYRRAEVEAIPFSPAVTAACEANRCGKYATCWTCPPAVNAAEMQRKVLSYREAWVFTCKYDLEDSFDFEGMRAAARETQKKLHRLVEELRLQGKQVLPLGCEGCILCEKCSYPDAPCRFPEKAIPSVEACGIDVVTLSKNLELRYHNGADTVTYFCLVLTD